MSLVSLLFAGDRPKGEETWSFQVVEVMHGAHRGLRRCGCSLLGSPELDWLSGSYDVVCNMKPRNLQDFSERTTSPRNGFTMFYWSLKLLA